MLSCIDARGNWCLEFIVAPDMSAVLMHLGFIGGLLAESIGRRRRCASALGVWMSHSIILIAWI
jgi:hypothetical protein